MTQNSSARFGRVGAGIPGAQHYAVMPVLALTLGLMTGLAAAQTGEPINLAPVPLAPGVIASPSAPLPAPVPQQSLPLPDRSARDLPSPDLPAPDLPAPDMRQAGLAPSGGLSSTSTSHQGGADMNGSYDASNDGAMPATNTSPAQVPPIWRERGSAVLDVLDKEDGAVHRITVPVGSSTVEGKLVVAVRACMVRPKDMTPDAAIFAVVTSNADTGRASSSGGTHLFKGWLIRSEPGATVIGDAAVTFRLIGCSGA